MAASSEGRDVTRAAGFAMTSEASPPRCAAATIDGSGCFRDMAAGRPLKSGGAGSRGTRSITAPLVFRRCGVGDAGGASGAARAAEEA